MTTDPGGPRRTTGRSPRTPSRQLRRTAQRRTAVRPTAGQQGTTPDAPRPPQPPTPPVPDDTAPRPDDTDTPAGTARHWTRHIEVLSTAIGSTLTAIAAIAAVLISVVLNQNDTTTTREGQITDRYTAAIDNLGNSSADVRLGGIYALQRIMKDSSRDQASIVDVLSAYIRAHSRPLGKESAGYTGRPEADVQAAFEVLARRNPAHDGSSEVDLREASLEHIAVRSADRTGTIEEDLTGVDPAHLQNSNLSGAQLNKANLPGSDLRGAYLVHTDLSGAALTDTDLRQDWLDTADLAHAVLDGARLDAASLVDAGLVEASLSRADLRNADLRGADLTGADLKDADLRGADLRSVAKKTVNGKTVGRTSKNPTHVTAGQLLTARLDSDTALPPALAADPRIKARIAESDN
ncbi:pentapeptide repeat-containing protein [Streptomyces sp. NPDC050508]|uniref:pentapeptide repeat-containing protein n=1 Tax=Streptomyces sp. NPDC050508 TaxID=3155405 RepID=UPI00341DB617